MSNYSIKESDDNKYLTVTIVPTSRTLAFPMQFSANTNFPLIENLGNYQVALDSASIPADNIPLWIPIIKPYPNLDNNLTAYSFTLSYNGISSDETFMNFISQNPNQVYIPLSNTQTTADYNSFYYYVYSINNILIMLNNTLTAAFNNLATKIALPANAVPPYFSFNNLDDKISINAQLNYYDIINTPNPIRVYSNYEMFLITDKLSFIYNNIDGNPVLPTSFLYYITNLRNNIFVPSDITTPPTIDDQYIKIEQEIPSISNLTPVKSICITSASIPVQSDYIPRKVGQNSSTVGEEVILTEFEPVLRFPQENVGNNILYRPQYRRYKNMKSQLSLQRIDISLYWRDIFGTLHVLYSNINKLATLRLVFRKKMIV